MLLASWPFLQWGWWQEGCSIGESGDQSCSWPMLTNKVALSSMLTKKQLVCCPKMPSQRMLSKKNPADQYRTTCCSCVCEDMWYDGRKMMYEAWLLGRPNMLTTPLSEHSALSIVLVWDSDCSTTCTMQAHTGELHVFTHTNNTVNSGNLCWWVIISCSWWVLSWTGWPLLHFHKKCLYTTDNSISTRHQVFFLVSILSLNSFLLICIFVQFIDYHCFSASVSIINNINTSSTT